MGFLTKIRGYDEENSEIFYMTICVEKILSVYEDEFEMLDDDTGNFIMHKGSGIMLEGQICYKVVDTYDEVIEGLKGIL